MSLHFMTSNVYGKEWNPMATQRVINLLILHPLKVLMSVYWDFTEIFFELFSRNETINSDIYCRQLRNLCEVLKKKNGPVLINIGKVIFPPRQCYTAHINLYPKKVTRAKMEYFIASALFLK